MADDDSDIFPSETEATIKRWPSESSILSGLATSHVCFLRWSRIEKKNNLQNTGLLSTMPFNAKSKVSKKSVLSKVSGCAAPGEILAIMGSSTSGKSDLLNILSCRSKSDGGVVSVSGIQLPFNSTSMIRFKSKISYVPKEDVFLDHLTVNDQLLYTAMLKLPEETDQSEKVGETRRVMAMLNLDKHRHTRIRDLNQEERKRLNIASEIMKDPCCIFLDEPTCGMDAVNSVALVRMLSSFARARSKAIVMTIDQPRSLLFRQFDKVLMLAEGQTIFFGSPADSVRYMDSHRMICPPAYTETDLWVEVLAMSLNDDGDADGESVTDCRPESDTDSDECTEEKDMTHIDVDGSVDVEKADQTKKRHQHRRRDPPESSAFSPLKKLIQMWDNDALAKQMDMESRRPTCLNGFAHCDLKTKSTSWVILMFDEFMRLCIRGDRENNKFGQRQSSTKSITQHEQEEDFAVKKNRNYTEFNTSWSTQYYVLIQRALKASRSSILAPVNVIKSVAIGLVVGLLYLQLEYTERALLDMRSYLIITISYWTLVAMFEELFAFRAERKVILKEHAGASYHLSAYFAAKATSELPSKVFSPLLYLTFSFWMVGINRRFDVFIFLTIITLLGMIAGGAVGLLVGACIYEKDRAVATLTVLSAGMLFLGGGFVDNIHPFIQAMRFLSPFNYAHGASCLLVFDRGVPCDESGLSMGLCGNGANGGSIPVDDVLEAFNVDGSIRFNIGLLLLWGIIPRFLAYLTFRFQKNMVRPS